MRRQRAFTLIELLVVIAIAALVVTLAAPSFTDFILMQRLKSINAQLVTDLQYARGEAASRNTYVRLRFLSDADKSCYSIYALKLGAVLGTQCNCLAGPGAACDPTVAVEIRTVTVPKSQRVSVLPQPAVDPFFAFDYRTGGLVAIPTDYLPKPLDSIFIDTTIDSGRTLRTTLNYNGRPTVCRSSDRVAGFPSC